jgi:hypothetical protein
LNNPLTRWIVNTWEQIVSAISQTWKWVWNLVWKLVSFCGMIWLSKTVLVEQVFS